MPEKEILTCQYVIIKILFDKKDGSYVPVYDLIHRPLVHLQRSDSMPNGWYDRETMFTFRVDNDEYLKEGIYSEFIRFPTYGIIQADKFYYSEHWLYAPITVAPDVMFKRVSNKIVERWSKHIQDKEKELKRIQDTIESYSHIKNLLDSIKP